MGGVLDVVPEKLLVLRNFELFLLGRCQGRMLDKARIETGKSPPTFEMKL